MKRLKMIHRLSTRGAVIPLAFAAIVTGCGSSSSGNNNTRPPSSSGGLPVEICPFANRDDASAALGVTAGDGILNGPGSCTFLPDAGQGSPTAAPASPVASAKPTVAAAAAPNKSQYLDINVTTSGSAEEAQTAYNFRSTANPVPGLGDAASFGKYADGGLLIFRSGSKVVRLILHSRVQGDPQNALVGLGKRVLSRLG